jgi:Carboxylesterase family
MWKQLRLAGVVLVAVEIASLAVAQQGLTESGALSDLQESDLNAYKGVPFAATPVGDLRWRPPEHVAPVPTEIISSIIKPPMRTASIRPTS